MNWVTYGALAGVVLGLYDFWTKKAMTGRSVLAVVFWSSVFGASAWLLALLPMAQGTPLGVRWDDTSWSDQAYILVKGVMMTGSWMLAYYAVRELPMSFAGAMRASGPLWTLLGGALVFQEFLGPLQLIMLGVSVGAYFLLSRIGTQEGIRLTRSLPMGLMLLATVLSALTTVYDKFLLQNLGLHAVNVQAWSAWHRCALSGLALAWASGRQAGAWRLRMTVWIPLVGLSWVTAECLNFLALADPAARVATLSVLRRVALIVGFFLSVWLIGERQVRQKSVVVGVLFMSTLVLALNP